MYEYITKILTLYLLDIPFGAIYLLGIALYQVYSSSHTQKV